MPVSGRLRIKVVPGARENAIVGREGDVWKIRVGVPAERGRANAALIELLAATLGVPKSAVNLVAGGGSRDKVIEVQGLSADQAGRLLAARQRKGR